MTKYIKATQVAEILGLSVNSVYGLKMRGKIQPAKIMKGKFWSKKMKTLIARILAILLLVAMLVPIFAVSASANEVTQRASAGDLISSYLNLSSGSKITSVETITSLQPGDLAVLSIYLSNFYVPYSSSLDGDTMVENVDNLIPILQETGFDRDAAKQLIELVYGYSLSSATKLYVKLDSSADSVNLSPVNNNGSHENREWRFILGDIPDSVSSKYTDFVGSHISDGSYNYVPVTLAIWNGLINHVSSSIGTGNPVHFDFYWSDGNTISEDVVFRMDEQFITFFSSTLEGIDSSTGNLGNSVFQGKINGGLESSDVFNLSESELASLFFLTQNFYIDWVGNIICDFGNRRVIVVPSVMNNSVFKLIDSDKDYITMLSSAFGFNLLNKYKKDSKGKFVFNFNGFKVALKGSRGSNGDIKWDSMKWSAKGADEDGAKLLKQTLSDWSGADVGAGDTWSAKYYSYGINLSDSSKGSFNTDKYYAYTELFSINDSMASLLRGEKEGIKVSSMWNFDLVGKHFTSRNKFASSSTNFNTILGVDSKDSGVLSDLLLTYLLAYANVNVTDTTSEDCYSSLKFRAVFPKLDETSITFSTTDATEEEVLSFVYYLLHPSKGAGYIVSLVKNKLSAVIVGWHEDIVGNTDSNVSLGATRYIGFSGYVTIPALNDIDWLAWFVSMYDTFAVYTIIIMSIILLCYIIIGQMSFHSALINLFIFGLLSFLPPVLVNSTVNLVNVTSNAIYGDKFDYWAMVQTQAYLSSLSQPTSVSETIANSVETTRGSLDSGSTGQSFNTVKVKWQTPKRLIETAVARDQLNAVSSSNPEAQIGGLVSIILNSYEKSNGKEDFLDSESATYLYRDYMDIYKYASVSYNLYNPNGFSYANTSSNNPDLTPSNIGTDWSGTINSELRSLSYDSGKPLYKFILANSEASSITRETGILDTSSLNAMRRGFLFPTIRTDSTSYFSTSTLAPSLLLRMTLPVNKIANDAIKMNSVLENGGNLNINLSDLQTLDSINNNVGWGIKNKDFDYSVNSMIADSETSISSGTVEKLHYMYYALYSESPFYFFNNNIRDQLIASNTGYSYNKIILDDMKVNAGHFKDYLLQENQALFFNMTANAGDGYGELRDFMNFHDFFYYVLPILQEGNNNVRFFEKYWGMYLYDDCSFQIDSGGQFLYNGMSYPNMSSLMEENKNLSDEEAYKLWHDYNVYALFNTYTTWLDVMNDCNYAKQEKIRVAGETFFVENPLDPTSYFELDNNGNLVSGRYMVFSESEMSYYGLKLEDLTQVERKIIEVQNAVYSKSLDLMNYYTLSDETLINAFAFIQLFEFNKAFSQNSFVSSDLVLYPQGYELKAFTYDAYLRLILTEGSGENLMDSGEDGGNNESIYTRILENTSIFFGVVLIANDLIAIYILPAIRFFFIIILFIMSIIMLISSAIKLNDEGNVSLISVVWKSLVAPLLNFLFVSIGLSFLISFFMSNGAQNVVRRGFTVSLGDPTMTIAIILIINCVAVILYYKICQKTFKDLVYFAKAVSANIGGVVAGTIQKLGFAVASGKGSREYAKASSGYHGSASSDTNSRGKKNASGETGGSDGGNSARNTANSAINAGIAGAIASSSYGSGFEGTGEGKKNKYDAIADKAKEKYGTESARNNAFDSQVSKMDKFASMEEKARADADKYSRNITKSGLEGDEWSKNYNIHKRDKALKNAEKAMAKKEKAEQKALGIASGDKKAVAKNMVKTIGKDAGRSAKTAIKNGTTATKDVASRTKNNYARHGLVGGTVLNTVGVARGTYKGIKAVGKESIQFAKSDIGKATGRAIKSGAGAVGYAARHPVSGAKAFKNKVVQVRNS